MKALEGAAAAAWAVPLLTALAVVATLIAAVRIVRGPRHADRVVALDIFLAAAVALCVAASLGTGRTVFLHVGIGLAFVGFVGTGVIVLPDALARQHAATKAGTLALATVCVGEMLTARDAAWTWWLLLILGFLLTTLPVASHLLARAAVREASLDRVVAAAPRHGV